MPDPNEATVDIVDGLADKVSVEIRKGHTVEYDRDKAIDFIRKGVGFEAKSKAMNEELQSKREAIALGEDFIRIRESNPEAARAIFDIANGKQPAAQASVDDDQLDLQELSDSERKLAAKNAALEAKIERLESGMTNLTSTLTQRDQETQQKDLDREITKEADTVKHWSERDREHFKPQILTYMHVNGATAQEAVHAIASEDKARVDRLVEERANNAQDGKRFRTTRVASGSPELTPKYQPPSGKDDLAKGRVLGAILENFGLQ